jgi:hypothetical protein
MDEELSGTPTLTDDEMSTEMGPVASTAMERRPGEDADGTDTQTGDGTDGDASDGDATDGTDGDSGDADGTDATDATDQ